ncbi:MAG: hypothetical protein IJ688_00330 [Treponema sp.]|nr:hypothetical protein [Treponema sp.]
MNKIEFLRLLSHLCVAGLFVYAWQTAGTKRNWKQLILPVTLAVLGIIFTISKNTEEKKTEQIAAEKADQMYYEEVFPELKMNLVRNDPFIIIPAYDEKFILMHPELKKSFVSKVPAEQIFFTELNIDFADGTWQLSVDERTSERVKAQFSKDGKFVLVSGMKEGNSIINISRKDETYGGSILVRVEEPEEWYEKLQEEIKLYSRENLK